MTHFMTPFSCHFDHLKTVKNSQKWCPWAIVRMCSKHVCLLSKQTCYFTLFTHLSISYWLLPFCALFKMHKMTLFPKSGKTPFLTIFRGPPENDTFWVIPLILWPFLWSFMTLYMTPYPHTPIYAHIPYIPIQYDPILWSFMTIKMTHF